MSESTSKHFSHQLSVNLENSSFLRTENPFGMRVWKNKLAHLFDYILFIPYYPVSSIWSPVLWNREKSIHQQTISNQAKKQTKRMNSVNGWVVFEAENSEYSTDSTIPLFFFLARNRGFSVFHKQLKKKSVK
jgi:hypothetical protein